MKRRPFSLVVTACITGALALGACSSSDSDEEAPRASDDVELTAVEGCEGVEFRSSYSDVSEVPRCEPGAPAAKPLTETTKVVIATPSDRISTVQPILAAMAMGEFEKENLEVEFAIMPSTDALQLVADEQVDAMVGSTSVGIFNAIVQGYDVRQIIGDGWLHPDSKMGFWMRADLDPADLKGKSIASAVGEGSSVNHALRDLLAEHDLVLSDLRWEQVDAADAATALENGAVDVASVLDPFWQQLEGNPDFTFVAPAIRPGDNVGGIHAGTRLLKQPEVTEALVRALIRTVNTYFIDENWQENDELLAAIEGVNGLAVDIQRAVPGQIYSWDIPDGAATGLQELYIDTGTLAQDEPIEESVFVDRSFIEKAVGHKHE